MKFDIDRVNDCLKVAGLPTCADLAPSPRSGTVSLGGYGLAALEEHYGLPGADNWTKTRARQHDDVPVCQSCAHPHPKHMTFGERLADVTAHQAHITEN